MKIENLKVNGFGKLENKEINFSNGINVIQGNNEAGKSTLLKFITSMFYGTARTKNGKNISDFEKLHKIILDGQYDIIVNCIGLLQRDCDDNIYNAIKINALLPHFLVKVTKNMKTKIVHLSTDCVFSGHKGSYKENDVKDGLSYYWTRYKREWNGIVSLVYGTRWKYRWI